jgi:hypothetical protein
MHASMGQSGLEVRPVKGLPAPAHGATRRGFGRLSPAGLFFSPGVLGAHHSKCSR